MTKQITISQLEEMIWEIDGIEMGDHEIDSHIVDVGANEDGEIIEGKVYNSYVYASVTLRSIDQPRITYTIDAVAHNKGDRYSLTGAYDFTVEVNEHGENNLDAPGFTILDIDGDEISEREAVHQVGNDIEDGVHWKNAVAALLPTKPVEVIA